MNRLHVKYGLQMAIPLLFMTLILLYVTSGMYRVIPEHVSVVDMTRSNQFPLVKSAFVNSHQNLSGGLQTTNAKLFKIKSGKSSVFVDDKGAIVLPQMDIIHSLNINQMEELFFRYIESIQAHCVRMVHIGNEDDGGYHVCETHVNINPETCLAYSFGIRKDFSFDDGVASTFGCNVYSFDPGDGQTDHKHSDNVTFYSIGIGGKDETIVAGKDKLKIMTLGSIKKMLGHDDRNIDILKIDTEGAEWDSLDNMIETGDIKSVNILIIEFHEWINPGNNPSLKNIRTTENFARLLKTMRGIYEAGFRIYFFRMWPYCHYIDDLDITRTACHEVHFLRLE